MKRSVLIFSPLTVVVASVFILSRSSATEPAPPSAASVSNGSSPLPQQLEKSSQIQPGPSAEDAGKKSIEAKYRAVADILNGESLKKPMSALYKEWGVDDKAVQKTLDVFHNMDMQSQHETGRRNQETSLEAENRTDPAKMQASKEQHEMNCALILAKMDRELLAILGSYLRVRQVKALKVDVMLKESDARSR